MEDKDLEKLVENLMKESSLESPSFDFAAKVMSAVVASEKSKALIYKPVISKRAWFFIFAGIIALFAFLIFNSPPASANSYFNFPVFSFDKFLKPFPGLQISSITANVLLLASLVIFIQFFLLKSYLDKRFEK